MNVTLRPSPLPPAMTQSEFLDWDGHITAKWEYDGVRPVPMTGGSPNRCKIVARLIYALLKRLDGTEWDVLVNAGLSAVGGNVRHPDVRATRTPSPSTMKLVLGMAVACEVISPGSVRMDRVDKVREYAAVPSLRRYVMLEQAAPVLAVLHRVDGGAGWGSLPLGAGDVLELPELGIAVPVDEIYAGVAFDWDDAPAGA